MDNSETVLMETSEAAEVLVRGHSIASVCLGQKENEDVPEAQPRALELFVGPDYIIKQSRILVAATRRYLAAVRELARVRKLQATAPPVRVNMLNVLAG